MEELFSKLCSLNGKNVEIQMQHVLFGSQTIHCSFCALDIPDKIGFFVKHQAIFLYCSEIKDYSISDSEVSFAGDSMKILVKIKK